MFGLLAPLALLDPAFWARAGDRPVFQRLGAPPHQQRRRALTGRKLAWAGLALSLLFVGGGATDWLVYRRIVRDEARQFPRSGSDT